MVAHLLPNTIKALEQFEIAGKYAWTDSSVCLYWIQGDGAYKQFVTNRVRKITEKGFDRDTCPHQITLQISEAEALPVSDRMTSGWWARHG